MVKFKVVKIPKKEGYNNGQYAQSIADYTLTGKSRPCDSVAFDINSDIPELKTSVKAERFTLATNVNGLTVTEQINDYLNRVHSTSWVYISNTGYGYCMNKTEFRAFLAIGCRSSLTDTSGRHNQPIQKVVRGSEESATGKISKFFASYDVREVTPSQAVEYLKSLM